MKFYVRFAKLNKVIAIENSSNKKLVRDKYIKWRNDVIVNSEEELCFNPKDLLNAIGGQWTIVTFEQIKHETSNTLKNYILEGMKDQILNEIRCHPDDLEQALKNFSGEKKGFIVSLGGHRYFVKKGKNLKTDGIYLVKEGKIKEAPKALEESYNSDDNMGEHDVVANAINEASLNQDSNEQN